MPSDARLTREIKEKKYSLIKSLGRIPQMQVYLYNYTYIILIQIMVAKYSFFIYLEPLDSRKIKKIKIPLKRTKTKKELIKKCYFVLSNCNVPI